MQDFMGRRELDNIIAGRKFPVNEDKKVNLVWEKSADDFRPLMGGDLNFFITSLGAIL